MTPDAGGVIVVAVHARRVPADEREAFAERLDEDRPPGAVLLRTCHRVELYAPGDHAHTFAERSSLPIGGVAREGAAAVRHVINVATGRDSVVLGEDQVLHQLRAALAVARTTGRLDPAIERLCAIALEAGRRVRSWRQGHEPSLADHALTAIERRLGPISGQRILVVGAGRMGRLAARAAVRAGANVAVSNRTISRAEELAAATGCRLEAFDPGVAISDQVAVIVALGGPWRITAATVNALRRSETMVVDLSVPPALDGAAAEALGRRLVTADALALEPIAATELPGLTSRIDGAIEAAAADYLAWQGRRDARSIADELLRRADQERQNELATLWRQLPGLEPETRDAIESMTRHLSRRLLRAPLERLGRDADGREGQAVRDIFAL